MTAAKPTAISLFSGIGGIDLAFSAAGFDIIAQVEIDDFCQKVLKHHAPTRWPNAIVYDDVRTFGAAQISYADIIVGGFPCQDISSANPSGLGLEGARSGLWSEFRRIVGEIRPRAVLLENVPNVTVRGGVRVIADLAALGYVGQWGVISAADAGASHKRERWWCVAYTNGVQYQQSQSAPQPESAFQRPSNSRVSGRRERYDGATVGDSQVLRDVADTDGNGHQAQGLQYVRAWEQQDSRAVLGDTNPDRRDASISVARVQGERHPNYRNQSKRWLSKSRLGGATHGLPSGVDRPYFPSSPYRPQYHWEAPRQIVQRGEHWSKRIQAIGNAVVPQVVYPIALNIREVLAHDTDS